MLAQDSGVKQKILSVTQAQLDKMPAAKRARVVELLGKLKEKDVPKMPALASAPQSAQAAPGSTKAQPQPTAANAPTLQSAQAASGPIAARPQPKAAAAPAAAAAAVKVAPAEKLASPTLARPQPTPAPAPALQSARAAPGSRPAAQQQPPVHAPTQQSAHAAPGPILAQPQPTAAAAPAPQSEQAAPGSRPAAQQQPPVHAPTQQSAQAAPGPILAQPQPTAAAAPAPQSAQAAPAGPIAARPQPTAAAAPAPQSAQAAPAGSTLAQPQPTAAAAPAPQSAQAAPGSTPAAPQALPTQMSEDEKSRFLMKKRTLMSRIESLPEHKKLKAVEALDKVGWSDQAVKGIESWVEFQERMEARKEDAKQKAQTVLNNIAASTPTPTRSRRTPPLTPTGDEDTLPATDAELMACGRHPTQINPFAPPESALQTEAAPAHAAMDVQPVEDLSQPIFSNECPTLAIPVPTLTPDSQLPPPTLPIQQSAQAAPGSTTAQPQPKAAAAPAAAAAQVQLAPAEKSASPWAATLAQPLPTVPGAPALAAPCNQGSFQASEFQAMLEQMQLPTPTGAGRSGASAMLAAVPTGPALQPESPAAAIPEETMTQVQQSQPSPNTPAPTTGAAPSPTTGAATAPATGAAPAPTTGAAPAPATGAAPAPATGAAPAPTTPVGIDATQVARQVLEAMHSMPPMPTTSDPDLLRHWAETAITQVTLKAQREAETQRKKEELAKLEQAEKERVAAAQAKAKPNSVTNHIEYKRFTRLFDNVRKCEQSTIDYINTDRKNLFVLFMETGQDSEMFFSLVLKRKQLKDQNCPVVLFFLVGLRVIICVHSHVLHVCIHAATHTQYHTTADYAKGKCIQVTCDLCLCYI